MPVAGDHVIGMIVVRREGGTVLVVTDKGFGKRTDVLKYRAQKRGGQGILTLRATERVGSMVALMEVVDSDDLMIITDTGVMIRLPVADIRATGRATQGVKVIKLDEGAQISSISTVIEEDAEDSEPSQNGTEPTD